MTEHKKEEHKQHKENKPAEEKRLAEKKPDAAKAEPQKIKIDALKAQENQSAADAKKTAELAEKLKAAEDKYLRLCAEFDNFRKRTEAEKIEHAKYAAGKFIEAVLPVLDSFERSQKALDADAAAGEEVKKGFALIHRQLEDVLQKFGVTKMTAVGQLFDPRFHEAVLQKESGQPAQTVLEELQTGYVLHDKVLRPAMVVVAK
ncbi:MAG: nucleotide exchange factor GrpE [Candidatus Margulisbacteria bacterium]|nr:nucleotide exchange factor GrpE [Candidatus Margulisiibacteriota bacterium]